MVYSKQSLFIIKMHTVSRIWSIPVCKPVARIVTTVLSSVNEL